MQLRSPERVAGICEGTGLSEVVATDLASAEPRHGPSRKRRCCAVAFTRQGVSKRFDIVLEQQIQHPGRITM